MRRGDTFLSSAEMRENHFASKTSKASKLSFE